MRPSVTSLVSARPGDLAPDRVEPGERHRVRRVVHDQVDAGRRLERADVAPLAPDDPPLHLFVRDVDHRDGRLADLVAGVALDRRGDDPPRPLIGQLGGLELELARAARAGVPHVLLDLGDDDLAGLVHRQAGEPLQLLRLRQPKLLGLALFGVDLALASLKRALPLIEIFELAVEVLLFLLEPLLLALDLGSSAAMLLLSRGPQPDRLVLGLEEDLLGPSLGLGAQLC